MGDPIQLEGKGIAIQVLDVDARTIFVIVTYIFPINSAKAIPILNQFCEGFVSSLS